MKYLKGVSTIAIAIIGLVGGLGVAIWLLLIGAGVLQGAAKLGMWLLPYLAWAFQIALLISVVVFLPMSLFHRTRGWAAIGFLISSFVYGCIVWVLGLLVTMFYWGPIAVIVGLFFMGIGVVPIGIVAAAVHSQWTEAGILLGGLVLTFGTRMLSMWLASKYDEGDWKRRNRIVDSVAS